MELSRFGLKLRHKSGISLLMEDLGQAMTVNRDMLMLGGGNPAFIPAVQAIFRDCMLELLNTPGCFEKAIGNYDSQQGNAEFIANLCRLLCAEFGWDITPRNIALTTGSQSAFFVLMNLFAGLNERGRRKKILLPLTPEYIGYADLGIDSDIFRSFRPEIDILPDRFFKYRIDFDALEIADDVGAVCLSRPTNPTGNVLTNDEVQRLVEMTAARNIPLILDNAYGTPFPNIIFTDVQPVWSANTIVCMSLSKFGLPGTRTGIVIASEPVIELVCEFNAIMSLAPNSMGAAIANRLVQTGEILTMSRHLIRPFYQEKCNHAVQTVKRELAGIDYYIHKPEGALFLWLWFPSLPISNEELYQRLKKRGVLIVPGHYFFPGLLEPWPHAFQCIRLTYSQSPQTVEKGIAIIADEVRRLR